MELYRQKIAMISQPMRGLTDEEIIEARDRAIKVLESKGYTVINSFFNDDFNSRDNLLGMGVIQIPIHFLHKSLETMSKCDTMYFCKGWDAASGCKIEHLVAKTYNMEVLYEE